MNINKININQSEPTYYIASDIYDVSAHNNGATFASLSELLSDENLSTLIPSEIRCGGMSIRFIQSSDNKYVQYRLMSSEWSTDIYNWENYNEITTYNDSLSDLNISDEHGYEIVQFQNGHIKTKNFDSENIKIDVRTDDTDNADLELSDDNKNIIAQFKSGHIITKNFDSRYVITKPTSIHLPDIPIDFINGSYYYGKNLNNLKTDNAYSHCDITLDGRYNQVSFKFDSKDSLNICVIGLDESNNVLFAFSAWEAGSSTTLESSVSQIDFPTLKRVVVNTYNADNNYYAKVVYNDRQYNANKNYNFIMPGLLVNCKIRTSSTLGDKKEYLMLYFHGNGEDIQNYGDDFNPEVLQYFKDNKINVAAIQYKGSWGNKQCITSAISFYNYMMSHYDTFFSSVILACGSMGGCTVGALAYKRPFPILFCLGIGPVPDIQYMFEHALTDIRKNSIRSAFEMPADGSDDANIADYVKGYNWYNMGMINEGVTKKKIGFPNFYLYYGVDGVFTTEFGGVEKYTEVYNALINAGNYSEMKNCGSGHATVNCYYQALLDNVFNRELGTEVYIQ